MGGAAPPHLAVALDGAGWHRRVAPAGRPAPRAARRTPPGPQRHPALFGLHPPDPGAPDGRLLRMVAVTAGDDPAAVAERLGNPDNAVLLDPDGPAAAQVALGVPALLPQPRLDGAR
ncbi:hypothetical protein AB0M46_45090 [Dactylosporangium sp. NPDC051485]|uniref:hypothetical protein n=1 Tax=Dactylosporangium sp. NPDC051485 TaxID=3154846 RepID=UPI003438D323